MLPITTPVAIPSGTPIAVVAKTLAECEGRQLPVVHEGRPIGVVRQEDLDDAGTLRKDEWFGWGAAKTARDVMTAAPMLTNGDLQDALRALLSDTVVVVCNTDGSLAGLLTEHDGVRVALEALPDDALALGLASKPVYAIDVEDPACHAEQHMRMHGIRHVVLAHEKRAIGVISHRDLVSEGVHRGRKLKARQVWKERPLLSVDTEAPLRVAADLLVDERVGAIPVLDAKGEAVAVLTRRDVIRAHLEHAA